jgi:hypothetical protein
MAINPGTHDKERGRDIRFGVGTAKKGWLGSGDVPITMTLEKIAEFLKRRRL